MGRRLTPSAALACGGISRSNLTGYARRLPKPRRRLLRPRRRAPRRQPRSLRLPRHLRPLHRALCPQRPRRQPRRAPDIFQGFRRGESPGIIGGENQPLGSALCPIVPIRRSSAANPA